MGKITKIQLPDEFSFVSETETIHPAIITTSKKKLTKLLLTTPRLIEASIKIIEHFDKFELSQCDAYYELKSAIREAQ